MVIEDQVIFETTVRRLLGGDLGPPKYVYRKWVRRLVVEMAAKLGDSELKHNEKILDHITDRVMEACASLNIWRDCR